MYALELNHITKKFGSFVANQDITLKVKKNTIHAIAGENGAGKSVLMKSLFGLLAPDTGDVIIDGKPQKFKSAQQAIYCGLGMVQQHFALSEELTALENIVLGAEPYKGPMLDRNRALKKLESIAGEFLKVSWNTPVENLNIGQKQKVEILKLLYRDAKILILDEPTAVLTPAEVKSLFSLLLLLKEKGCTILIIAHKISEILSISDEVSVLKQGQMMGTFPTSEMNEQKLVHLMVGHEVKNPTPELTQNQNVLLKIENLKTSHEHGPLKNLNLEIYAGEILGIAGVQGNGQEALVEALLKLCPYQGKIQFSFAKNCLNTHDVRSSGISYVAEDRHSQSIALGESLLFNSLIGQEDRYSKTFLLQESQTQGWLKKCIQDYQIKCHSEKDPIQNLSGGNQQKLVVARELDAANPKLLIASHPTRGVDIGASQMIYDKLMEHVKKQNSVLLISSDLDELMSLSNRIAVIFNGQINAIFSANNGFDKEEMGSFMAGASQ